MKMRTFQQNKLWREKMVEVVERMGSIVHLEHLNDADFDKQLRVKLIEEAQEVAASRNRSELITELADVFEVIDTICKLHQIERETVESTQIKKREERGGFSGHTFVTRAEHPQGSFSEKYCLAEPTKYPEIT